MRSFLRSAALLLTLSLLFAACSSLPDHAKYIPNDALVVVGVNTKVLSDKIAWSAITGSSFIDELAKATNDSKGKEIAKDLENAGIEYASTIYFYAKRDERFDDEAKMCVIVPLKDRSKWEAFVKKQLPEAAIAQVEGRSEMAIDKKAYASWNDKVLMVMTMVQKKMQHTENAGTAAADTVAIDDMPESAPYTYTTSEPDASATAAEMAIAFKAEKKNSIVENKRFKSVEGEHHDVSFFLNYEKVMDIASSKGAGMGGLNFGASLYKNSAMTAGLDFNKGALDGTMHYYSSDSLKDVFKAFAGADVDKEMYSRISGDNLNLLMGYHLNPEGIRLLMVKLNLLGIANMALMQQGMSVEEILSAFSGDFVFAMNNFRMQKETVTYDFDIQGEDGSETNSYTSYNPKMDYVVAMKINKQDAFKKLVGMLEKAGINAAAPNMYMLPMGRDTAVLMTGDKYAVFARSAAAAQAYMAGKPAKALASEVEKEVAGHPVGMYWDAKNMLTALASGSGNASDSTKALEASKVFQNVYLNGGEMKGDAIVYHMSVNFSNKEENSLLQILSFAKRIAELERTERESEVLPTTIDTAVSATAPMIP